MSAPRPRTTFFEVFIGEMFFRLFLGIAIMIVVAAGVLGGRAWQGQIGSLVGMLVGFVVGIAAAVLISRARDRRQAARDRA